MSKHIFKLNENCTVEFIEVLKGDQAKRHCIGYLDANGKQVNCDAPIYHHNKSGRCARCNGANSLLRYRNNK